MSCPSTNYTTGTYNLKEYKHELIKKSFWKTGKVSIICNIFRKVMFQNLIPLEVMINYFFVLKVMIYIIFVPKSKD